MTSYFYIFVMLKTNNYKLETPLQSACFHTIFQRAHLGCLIFNIQEPSALAFQNSFKHIFLFLILINMSISNNNKSSFLIVVLKNSLRRACVLW